MINTIQNLGFTLIELLLVMSLFSMVAVFMFPMRLSFYNSETLATVESGIRSALQSSRTYAQTQKNDMDHGVKILSSSYVLFEGLSYETRDESKDTVVPIASVVSVTGFDEIVFEKFTGTPSATGTLLLELHNENSSIVVYEAGVIQ